jgi:hypothetical protein
MRHDSTSSQLLKLIDEALSKPLSFDETTVMQVRLANLLQKEGATRVIDEAGMTLRRWLDDWDIRQRDSAYAKATTRKLREWHAVVLAASRSSGGDSN